MHNNAPCIAVVVVAKCWRAEQKNRSVDHTSTTVFLSGLNLCGGGGFRRSSSLGGGWSLSGGTILSWSGWVLVLLAGAVDRDLNSNLATLNLLAVHVGAGLLLKLLTRERHEAETTTLARLVAGLELADHELGDWAEGNLGGGGRVVGEDLEELKKDDVSGWVV